MATAGGLSLGTLWLNLEAQVDGAAKTLEGFSRDVSKQIEDQRKKWDDLSNVGDSFIKLGAGLTAAITIPLVGLGVAAVGAADKLQVAKTAFTTMLGSASAADKMLKELQAFAASTPFEFPDLVEAAQRMKALGFQSDQIIPILRTVGDTAAAMGKGKDVIDGITLALGQMSAKGKVSAQEMQQLAERGVPAWQYLADAIGKDIPTAMKMAENGAIKASTAIPAILAGMNKDFAGSMDAMSKTLSGQWSNMKDQITLALIPIGQVLMPMLQGMLPVLSSILSGVKSLAEGFKSLPQPIQTIVIGLGGMLAAIGPLAVAFGGTLKLIGEFAPQISLMKTAITNVAFAINNNLVGALSSWEVLLLRVAVAAGLMAAAFVGYELGSWIAEVQKAGEKSGLFQLGLAKLGDQVETLDKQLKAGKITAAQYAEIVEAAGKRAKEGLGGDAAEQRLKNFRREIEATTPTVEQLEKQMASYGVIIQRGSMDQDKWTKALIDHIGWLKENGFKTKDEEKAINAAAKAKEEAAAKAKALADRERELADAAAAAAEKHKKLEQNLQDAKQNLDRMEDAARRGKIGWDSMAGAAAEVKKAQAALDAELIATNKNIVKQTGSVAEFTKKTTAALPPLDQLAKAAREDAGALDVAISAAALMGETMAADVAPIGAVAKALDNTKIPALTTADAFKQLRMVSSEAFGGMAYDAWQSYDVIVRAQGAWSQDAKRAYIEAMQAQSDYEASLGGVSAATQLELARAQMAQDDFINNSVNGWRNLAFSLKNSMQDVFHTISEAVFSGDWSQAKDRILDDLKNMGVAVLEKFTKPATDAIASFVANTLTDLLSGQGLGGVMSNITGLGSALGGIFKGVGSAGGSALELGGIAGTVFPGIASGAAKAAGGAASSVSGVMSGIMGALNPIGMIGSAVSAVTGILDVLGIGVGKKGEIDRMNNIANDTRFLAWTFDTGGARIALLDMRHTLVDFMQPTLERIALAVEATNYALDQVQANGAKQWNLNLTGSDPQLVAAYLATQLRMQGGQA